mmetsp:Transcript_24895/g.47240  ORF Transcript_24895/g.47240 Transcript_24895/m.47240 type:complete len:160 (+) Transcript_24895:657-1136(+)
MHLWRSRTRSSPRTTLRNQQTVFQPQRKSSILRQSRHQRRKMMGSKMRTQKKQSDGKDKKSDDKNKKEASKTDKSVDKNKKDSSKQTKDEGKGKKDGKGKQDLPKSSKDNKDHKNDKQPDVTMLMSRAERHEMAEARRKANAKRRAKMHKRRSGGDRRR